MSCPQRWQNLITLTLRKSIRLSKTHFQGLMPFFESQSYRNYKSFRPLQGRSKQMSSISQPRVFSNHASRELDSSGNVEEETLPHYIAERYYPVRIGEIFQSRYQVLTKLGYGSASTIWLCRDLWEHRYLVLKVHVRSKRKLPEIAVVEHLRVNKDDHPGQRFVRLISDSFEVIGPHGTHTCLLYPPAGLDMSDCMQCLPGETLTVPLLRAMVRNILLALDYLHQANIIHTDIHPNNILAGVEDESVLTILERDELSSPSPRKQDGDRIIYLSRPMFLTDGEPLLSDLGEARLGQSHKGTIMPSLYRAPEVILGLDWNNKVDIWGFGQTIWTIFQGSHVFRSENMGELDKMQRFAEMTSCLGSPPQEFRNRSPECADYWDENGNWRGSVSIHGQSLELREKQLDGEEKEQFLRLMRKMLAWPPEERPSAEELLYDEWIRGNDY
ncbi:srpk [Aspergillus flavus]|nr:srpk [Aspergillus flavus]